MPSTRSKTTTTTTRSYADATRVPNSPLCTSSVSGCSNPTTPSAGGAFTIMRCPSDEISMTPSLKVIHETAAEDASAIPVPSAASTEGLFFSACHVPFASPEDDDRRVFITYVASEIDHQTRPLPRDYAKPLVGIDAIPTLVYLDRISQLTGMESGAFIAALVLLSRVFEKHRGLALTPLNAKRLIVASTLVASKLFSDEPCANVLWARFSGTFGLDEINAMEGELLSVLGFDLVITEEEYEIHVARAREQVQA